LLAISGQRVVSYRLEVTGKGERVLIDVSVEEVRVVHMETLVDPKHIQTNKGTSRNGRETIDRWRPKRVSE